MRYRLHLPKWGDVLIAINKSQCHNRYSEKIIRSLQGSITHLRELIKALHYQDLIRIMPKKKIKYLEITDKGHRILNALQIIKFELKGI
jgi:predicted transcriptional regulator